MNLRWIVVVLYIILGGIDSYASEHQGKRIAKPFLIPLLFGFGLLSRMAVFSFLSYGLLCGWIGDILLMHKTNLRMKLGTLFFLLGHVFYILWFIERIQISSLSPFFIVISLIAYLLTGVVLEKTIMFDQSVHKKVISIIYMTGIGFMSWKALLAGLWVSWIGTLFFILSDSFILDQTVHHKPQKGVMPTYLLAQFLIVSGSVV